MAQPLVLIDIKDADIEAIKATISTVLLNVATVTLVGAPAGIEQALRSEFGTGAVRIATDNSVLTAESTEVVTLTAGVCVGAASIQLIHKTFTGSETQIGRVLLDTDCPLIGATWFGVDFTSSRDWTYQELTSTSLEFDRNNLGNQPNLRRWVRADQVGVTWYSNLGSNDPTVPDLNSWAKKQRLVQLKRQVWGEQTRPRLATIKRKLVLVKQRRNFHHDTTST